MKRIIPALLFLLAAPAFAAIAFNGGAAMTTNASFTGSKRPPGGGVILHVSGTFDGASVALEVNGGQAWIAADTCYAMTAAQVCRAAVGPVDLRITITGAGGSTSISAIGFEAQAVVSSAAGAAATWGTITGGTSTEDFLVGTGGSFGPTGSGEVTASTALEVSSTDSGSDSVVTISDSGVGAVIMTLDGTATWEARLAYFGVRAGGPGNGPVLLSTSPSATVPVIIPNRNETDSNSGMGWAGQGLPNLIADGTEVFRAASTYGSILGCKYFGSLAAAPTGSECDTYYDSTEHVLCVHTGSGFVQADDFSTACS